MKNVYFLLNCNFTGGFYEIGYGPESASDKFFESFRGKYGYDKHGESYEEEDTMAITVSTFETKEQLIEFVSRNVGVAFEFGDPKRTPEDIKQEKISVATEMVNEMKLHKV